MWPWQLVTLLQVLLTLISLSRVSQILNGKSRLSLSVLLGLILFILLRPLLLLSLTVSLKSTGVVLVLLLVAGVLRSTLTARLQLASV